MEISMKSSFRFKALVIALVATILASTCSTVFGFSLKNLFKGKEESELGLNRKVEIIGKTYYYNDGRAKKILKKGQSVRKEYSEENPGCGIITIVNKKAKYPYYVAGEGWVAGEDLRNAERYITLEFTKNEEKGGINAFFHINGEFVNVESSNDGIIEYKDGVFKAGMDGETTIVIHRKNKEDLELMAVVFDGNIQLNIPEKSLSAEVENLAVSFADGKLAFEGSGNAEVGLAIDKESGEISLAATGNGDAAILVTNKDGEQKEIASMSVEGDMSTTLNLKDKSLSGEANATQTMTILDKLSLEFNENANATIDAEHVEAEVGGSIASEDKELASASTGAKYVYGEEDPTVNAKLNIGEKEVLKGKEVKLPIISTVKALFTKLFKK